MMRPSLVHLALPALLGAALSAQGVRLPQVFDRTLGNGVKVLVVERPGGVDVAEDRADEMFGGLGGSTVSGSARCQA